MTTKPKQVQGETQKAQNSKLIPLKIIVLENEIRMVKLKCRNTKRRRFNVDVCHALVGFNLNARKIYGVVNANKQVLTEMMHHLTPEIIEYGKKKLYKSGHGSGWSQVPGDDPEVQHVC
ncbi:hypothetical protein BRARA_B01746 [Brassica rapa]|uniref:Uncharacterized protein n=1 Tax=Brassica campestris TaxID=3711 RepID=A0A398AGB3_BRACM|nr:hypothetical protein BRARA_B01746 [Brassica rapa]